MSGSPETDDVDDAIRRAKRELKEALLPTLADPDDGRLLPATRIGGLLAAIGGLLAATRIGVSRGAQAVHRDWRRIVTAGLSHAPLVLAIILFLFITAEVWEFFGKMGRDRFFVVLGLFAVGVTGAIIAAIWDDKSKAVEVATRSGDCDLRKRAYETMSGRELIDALPSPVQEDRRNTDFGLTGAQQWNVLVVFASPFLFIVLFVAFVWFVAFLVLGFVGVDLALTQSWTKSADVSPLLQVGIVGQNVVTEPLLRVAGVLAVLAGLTFVVEVIRTKELREELVEVPCEKMSNLIALWVWCKYAEEANSHPESTGAGGVRDP
jgi:hypothetical protein